MDAQLRAQAALPKDPGLIPSTYVGAYSYLTSFPEDHMPSSVQGHQTLHTPHPRKKKKGKEKISSARGGSAYL